ncbi:MAG: hypothetical protein HN509_16735 [Halobacteriovoraceae bacterium]|jgi:hypothetical protein|nr:hypothetical protein [Halobacteriovoraceae bacterium]
MTTNSNLKGLLISNSDLNKALADSPENFAKLLKSVGDDEKIFRFLNKTPENKGILKEFFEEPVLITV